MLVVTSFVSEECLVCGVTVEGGLDGGMAVSSVAGQDLTAAGSGGWWGGGGRRNPHKGDCRAVEAGSGGPIPP